MNTTITREDSKGFESILNQLTLKEGEISEYLVTRSRQDYDRLLRAALVGRTPETVTLGRSGMRLNRKVIIPPDSILCC
jgi:hypothetical protein